MNEVSRQEKKYAVNLWDSVALRGRLDAVMHGDAHNGAQGYVIRSLYFDTPDDQDFSGKIDGLELRRKIRLRTYSPQSDFAMLEMKQKQGPYQRKRSLRLTPGGGPAPLPGGLQPPPVLRGPLRRGVLRPDALPVLPAQDHRGVPPAGLCGPGEPHPHHPGQPDHRHRVQLRPVFRTPPHVPGDGPLPAWCWRSNTTAFCSAISKTCWTW